MKTILPSLDSYGEYSSENYGAHCLRVTLPNAVIYFSYRTPVAFCTNTKGLIVRKNDWGTTTGKHLNWIDGGDKKSRVSSEEFEKLFAEHFGKE